MRITIIAIIIFLYIECCYGRGAAGRSGGGRGRSSGDSASKGPNHRRDTGGKYSAMYRSKSREWKRRSILTGTIYVSTSYMRELQTQSDVDPAICFDNTTSPFDELDLNDTVWLNGSYLYEDREVYGYYACPLDPSSKDTNCCGPDETEYCCGNWGPIQDEAMAVIGYAFILFICVGIVFFILRCLNIIPGGDSQSGDEGFICCPKSPVAFAGGVFRRLASRLPCTARDDSATATSPTKADGGEAVPNHEWRPRGTDERSKLISSELIVSNNVSNEDTSSDHIDQLDEVFLPHTP